MPTIKELKNWEELEWMYEESTRRPVFIFKHSDICPLSTRAFTHYESFVDRQNDDFSFVLVRVRVSRELSNEIAERTGVKHESPQAILLIGGKAVWDDSHYEITKDKLEQVVMMYENKAFTD